VFLQIPPELVVVEKGAYNIDIFQQGAGWQGFAALRGRIEKCCKKSSFGQLCGSRFFSQA
jgi:hypothetical protein